MAKNNGATVTCIDNNNICPELFLFDNIGNSLINVSKFTGVVFYFDRHDFCLPIHADNAKGIIAGSSDSSGNMRTVAVDVLNVSVSKGRIKGRIPSVDVVDVAIAVVIATVSWDFTSVDPEIALKIGMSGINTGVDDRDAAARLVNTDLFVPRDRLPPIDEDDTWYHADLVGLAVVTETGAALGTVTALHNFGAGDLIEIATPQGGEPLLLPFTEAEIDAIS